MAISLHPYNSCLHLQPQHPSPHAKIRTSRVRIYRCSQNPETKVNATKYNRKPRPSFFELIQHKWSVKPTSNRQNFPWQQQQQNDKEEEETEAESEVESSSFVSDTVSFTLPSRKIEAPWVRGNRIIDSPLDIVHEEVDNVDDVVDNLKFFEKMEILVEDTLDNSGKEVTFSGIDTKKLENEVTCYENIVKEVKFDSGSFVLNSDREAEVVSHLDDTSSFVEESSENLGKETSCSGIDTKKLENEVTCDETIVKEVKFDSSSFVLTNNREAEILSYLDDLVPEDERLVENSGEFEENRKSSIESPWKRREGVPSVEGDGRMSRSNTELAERTLPEHELKRLRNVALRMLERIKVGAGGITRDLVDAIHRKWKLDEVVKLKFEEPLSQNMKRAHEMLESRTGGLVIWRSGSSVVLYRGITYKFQCAKSYSERNEADVKPPLPSKDVVSALTVGINDFNRTTQSFLPSTAKYLKDLSQEELMDFTELNQLLDDLGPRFEDWYGQEPLPVDADRLPSVVPGYKPPYRLLPYGVRECLKNKEMTMFRRLARTMAPHFALGRSRELQGLAKAMVKLWESSAIVKIAIKRGVQNTNNERMAEELKRLTGGTLLSRNKEYIVFYRGNDFLPPAVTDTLKEREKLSFAHEDEEDHARQMASNFIGSKTRISKVLLVAGTLAETRAATSRWGKYPDSKDMEEMIKEAALTRCVALVKHLQDKLATAKGKLKLADIALAKIQKHLEPTDLPDDLETLTDEERFLFRKVGHSMKPYLFLGRRSVYSGTIENMHLHWKYRELVKIIVKGKSFAQVKQIAVSLEAESGGVLVSIDETTKGFAVIVYRGKNYLPPSKLKPDNLLTRRQALARSIELQRREALKHHIADLQERLELVKSEVKEMEASQDSYEETTSQSTSDIYSHEDAEEDKHGRVAF